MSEDQNKPIFTSLAGAVKLIANTPKVRFLLRGEPGVGKSAIRKAIRKMLGYPEALIDCANLSLGDLAIPVPNHDDGTINWYHNARFKLQLGVPVIMTLDELLKAGEEEMNMLHPMLEVDNPRLGDIAVPEGSIIFATSNLDSDGVGDQLPEHTRQRIVELIIRKPNAEEFLKWAAQNNINPTMRAWVDRYPYALDSYVDGNVNEFNLDPTKPNRNVVSPRVFEIASRLLDQREAINDDAALLAALCGAGGKPFGESLMAFVEYQDQMPKFQDIVDDPLHTAIPEEVGARAVLIYGLVHRATSENFEALMDYIERIDDPEWQTVFCLNVANTEGKKMIAFTDGRFAKWLQENEDIL
jgi:hypothetical protein